MDKQLNLIEACKEYWEVRRIYYEAPEEYKSGSLLRAKMKMYKAMSELWGKTKDFYEEYE